MSRCWTWVALLYCACQLATATPVRADDSIEIEVPWVIGDMVANPVSPKFYMVNETDGDLLGFGTYENLADVDYHFRSPYSLVDAKISVSADGSTVYLSAPKAQRLFILNSNLLVTYPNVPGGIGLELEIGSFVVAADGFLYALDATPADAITRLNVVKIDPVTGLLVDRVASSTFRRSSEFRLSSDGNSFYVLGSDYEGGSFQEVNEFATTGAAPVHLTQHFSDPVQSVDLSVDDGNDQLYRVSDSDDGIVVWNTTTQTQSLWTFPGAGHGIGIAQSPGSDSVWAANATSSGYMLSEFNKQTNAPTRQIPIGEANSSLNPGSLREGHLEFTVNDKLVYSKRHFGSSSPNAVDGYSYYLGLTDNSLIGLHYNPSSETPFAPSDLDASDEADLDEVYISWTESLRATSYRVSATASGGSSRDLGTVQAPTTTMIDTDALRGETYRYRVAAVNSTGQSPYNFGDDGSVVDVPGAPAGFSATDGEFTDQVVISRAFVPGEFGSINGFRIYRSETNDFSTATEIGAVGDRTLTDTTAIPGELYYYWGRLENDVGLGAVATVNTGYSGDRGPPGEAPTNVKAADGLDSVAIYVHWAPVANARSYEVLRSTTDDPGTASVIGATIYDSYNDGDVGDLTVYFYWVRAVNGIGAGPLSASNSGHRLEQSGPPATPNVIAASDGSEYDHILVNWSYRAEAFNYTLYRHTSDDFSSATAIVTTLRRSLQDTSAILGTNYYYWVTANNYSGSSAPGSSDVGFVGVVPPPSEPPVSVAASDGDFANQVRITWTSTTLQPTFEIYRGTVDNSASATLIGTTAEDTFDDLTADPLQDYFYWVKVSNSSGTSGWSTSDAGHATIGVPASVYATNKVFDSMVRVTWNSVQGAEHYRVFRSTSGSSSSATEIASIAAPDLRFEDTSAVPGTSYRYWVKAELSGNRIGAFSDYHFGVRAEETVAGTGFTRLLDPRDVAFDVARNRAYITTAHGLVEVYDLIEQKIISAEWNTEGLLAGADISPDNDTLVLGQRRFSFSDPMAGVDVIDLESGQLQSYEYTREANERGSFDVAMLNDNQALVTTHGDNSDDGRLRKLDLDTGMLSLIDANGAASGFGQIGSESMIAITPDRRFAAVQERDSFYESIFYFDSLQNRLGTTSVDAEYQLSGTVSPDGEFIAIMKDYEVVIRQRVEGTIVQSISLPSCGVLFDPVRPYLYVTNSDEDKVHVYSTHNWNELLVIDLAESVYFGREKYEEGHLSMSQDGRWLAVIVDYGVEWLDMSAFPLVPLSPTLVTASDFTLDTGISVTWSAVAGAAHYNVYRSETNDPASAIQIASNLTQPSMLDIDTTAGSPYYYWIQSSNAQGNSLLGTAEEGERRISPPGRPLSYYGRYVDRISLVWTPPTSATSFDLYRSTDDEVATSVRIATGQSEASFDDFDAVVGIRYYYWIQAFNGSGGSELSPSGYGSLARHPPGNITLLTDNGRIELQWEAPEAGVSYDVYRGDTDDPAQAIKLTTTSSTSFIDSTAERDRFYYWFVKERYSDFGETVSGRRGYISPQNASAGNSLATEIRVNWSSNSGYGPAIEIRRSTSNDFSTATTVQDKSSASLWDVDAPTGVPVYYWLRSKSATATSKWTAPVQGFRRQREFDEFTALSGLEGEDAAPFSDPDDDGFNNFEEWAQGGSDPTDSSSRPPLIARFETVADADHLTVSYLRFVAGNENGAVYEHPSADYTTEGTLDLESGTWQNIPLPTLPPPNLETAPDGYEWGCVRLPLSTEQSALGFLQLQVTRP